MGIISALWWISLVTQEAAWVPFPPVEPLSTAFVVSSSLDDQKQVGQAASDISRPLID